jgi:MFS family permease
MARIEENQMSAVEARPVARSINVFIFAMLFLCYVVNLIDRSIISFVAIPMKKELNLSDGQFGILTGPVFSITYGLFAFVFAYYADRGNRARILVAVLILWSVATAACSLVNSFLQLFLGRLLVGVGEAGGTPTAMALVTDCAPKERLSSAYAIFILATPCGVLLAAVSGSYIAEHFGWRMAFLVCGLVGLPLAALIGLKLRDPRAELRNGRAENDAPSLGMMLKSIGDALRVMSSRQAMLLILFSYSVSFFLGTGVLNWAPIFFSRYHAFSPREASLYSGVAFCIGVIPGILLGGLVTDRLAKSNIMWMLYVPAVSIILSMPPLVIAYCAESKEVALLALAASAFLSQMSLGPMVGSFNALVPSEIRTIANSSLLLGAAIVSGGLDNVLVGALSDQLKGTFGTSSLRVGLLGVTLVSGVLSAIGFLLATRRYKEDLRQVGW